MLNVSIFVLIFVFSVAGGVARPIQLWSDNYFQSISYSYEINKNVFIRRSKSEQTSIFMLQT